MRIRSVLASLALLLVLSGCGAARRLDKSLDVSPNEAAIVGHIKIVYNGEDVTEGSAVLFNEFTWGTYGYQVPKDGWILMRLPLGTNHIARLGFAKFLKGQFHYDFQPGQTWFRVSEGGKTYYIGHINVEWAGTGFKTSQMFGLVGALVDQASSDGTLKLGVEDKGGEAKQLLKQRFGAEPVVVTALVGSG